MCKYFAPHFCESLQEYTEHTAVSTPHPHLVRTFLPRDTNGPPGPFALRSNHRFRERMNTVTDAFQSRKWRVIESSASIESALRLRGSRLGSQGFTTKSRRAPLQSPASRLDAEFNPFFHGMLLLTSVGERRRALRDFVVNTLSSCLTNRTRPPGTKKAPASLPGPPLCAL